MKNTLPLTTVDWAQKFKRRKNTFLLISLMLAVFVSMIGYKVLHHAKNEAELVAVLVAKTDIPPYTKLESTNFQFRKMRRDELPKNAIQDPKTLKNKISLITISKNQILVSQFFQENVNPDSLSLKISDNKKAISVGFDWFNAPVPDIKIGDYIDIVASESHKKYIGQKEMLVASSELLVSRARVLNITKEGDYKQSGHLVLEVTDKQTENLMEAKALGVLMNVVITKY